MKLPASLLLIAAIVPAWATPVTYQTQPLAKLAVYPEQQALATVLSDRQARLAAEAGGRVDALPAQIGTPARRGTVLARIDARSYEIELKRANAQLALLQNRAKLSQQQLDQARALNQQAFISTDALRQRETERAVIEAELRMAEQGLASARLALEKTRLRAPFDGVVRERLVAVGDTVAPGQIMLEFSAATHRQLRARLSAAELQSLQQARELRFVASEHATPVRLLRISPLVDPAAQTRDVILQANTALPAGQAGSLRWRDGRPALPASFVQQRQGKLGVFVLEAGQPVFKALPEAKAGRAVTLDWPLNTPVVDQGRHAIGLKPAAESKP